MNRGPLWVWVLCQNPISFGSLNGHVFFSETEARQWMAQPHNPAESGYYLEKRVATVIEGPHCGTCKCKYEVRLEPK